MSRRRAAGDDLAYGILRAVRRILRRVSDHARDLASRAGLTVPQLLCLRALAEEEPGARVTAAQVSRRLRLSPPTVCRVLDRLEAAGHVRRVRDRADRRRVFLAITPAGRAALAASPTPLQEEFLARLRALRGGERRRLLGSLETVVAMMEAGGIDAAPLIAPGDQPRPAPPRRRARQ